MRKITPIIMTLAAMLLACSCNKEGMRHGQGGLTLGINVYQGSTKAAMTDQELLETAKVNLYKADFSGLVRSYTYQGQSQMIYLPADSYRADVEAGEIVKPNPAKANWQQRSYRGSKEFVINAGATQNLEIVAKICNVVSRISFDETIGENFKEGYTLTIGLSQTDESEQLVYTQGHSGRDGYFIAQGFEPSLYWEFSGVRKKDNESVVKKGEIRAVENGKLYKLSPKFTVKDGDLEMALFVDITTFAIEDIIIYDPVSTGLSASKISEIWAGHATVHADVDEVEFSDPSKIFFAYSKDGENWEQKAATRKGEGVYDAVLTSLQPSTLYTYKLVIDGNTIGESLTFTTEAAPQMPNSNLETTSNADSDRWVSFYDPSSSDASLKTKFWDSGSSASAGMLGAEYAICYSDSDVPAGIGSTKSARLQSLAAAGKMAAGNLFTGEFAGTVALDGKVNFGRPFTARPTALRFWYKYNGGIVDKTAPGAGIELGERDVFSIQVALGSWNYRTYGGTATCPVQVFTADKNTFWVYPDMPETIAYGKLEERGSDQPGEWKQVTIPLDYYSTTATPTHIIVACAASKYGDFFAGSTTTALFVDEFELLYE